MKQYVQQMPARTAHFQTGTFQTLYDIDFKSKVVSFNEENLKMILDLNPIRHRGHLTLFYPIQPYFSKKVIKSFTFQAFYDLGMKNKGVSLSDYNLLKSWHLNPISNMGHLTLFYPIQPHFSNSVIKSYTFQAYYDLGWKNKGVILSD